MGPGGGRTAISAAVISSSGAAGGNAYVHCWGGSGRTGTAIGCWLQRHRLATPGDVIKSTNRLRDGDLGGGLKPTPNTKEQAKFIKAWREGD